MNWKCLISILSTFQGSGILLADTLSRIKRVHPDMKPDPEKEGYEFGYLCFEELPPAEVFIVEEMVMKEVKLQPE